MSHARLSLALDGAGLELVGDGHVSVFHPSGETMLTPLNPQTTQVVTGVWPDFAHFQALGYDCVTATDAPHANALICMSRARVRTRAAIALATATCARVIVDGVKKDGIDSILKECRKRVAISDPISKAHGKLFWFDVTDETREAFADWAITEPAQITPEFVTLPGVFSADGIDPASLALARALPVKLGKTLADFGAGWGYLSAQILSRPEVERLDMIEADHDALTCARQNVTDARAVAHWADALRWTPEQALDGVIMNPPFHTGRAADPSLGRDFIRAAASVLKPSGQLWMVANRHLPYEKTLEACFAKVVPMEGDGRFKLFHASRPLRQKKR